MFLLPPFAGNHLIGIYARLEFLSLFLLLLLSVVFKVKSKGLASLACVKSWFLYLWYKNKPLLPLQGYEQREANRAKARAQGGQASKSKNNKKGKGKRKKFRLYIKHLYRYPPMNQSVAIFYYTDGLNAKQTSLTRFHQYCLVLLRVKLTF